LQVQENREAVSQKFRRENNLVFKPEQIIISSGAKHSLANVLLALINPGDEVILLAPFWGTYRQLIRFLGAKPVIIETTIENGFKAGREQIKRAITPKTKALILNSPSNPAGCVYSADELRGIADIVSGYKYLYIISDEIYEHINFTGPHETIGQFDFIKDRTIIINGVSKGYAMTGWRIGYLGAPAWLAKACSTIQGHTTSGACSVSQMAAIAALQSGLELPKLMKNIYQKRRDMIRDLLHDITGLKVNNPDGTFYIYPDISAFLGTSSGKRTINTDLDLCMYLLEEAHVALVPGSAFGNERCIRISFATSEERIIIGMGRIKKALADL